MCFDHVRTSCSTGGDTLRARSPGESLRATCGLQVCDTSVTVLTFSKLPTETSWFGKRVKSYVVLRTSTSKGTQHTRMVSR
jgi:hypothetical protein